MRGLDFSSWQSLLTTLVGIVVISFVMVGIRLVMMQTIQQRRERENRQINERLRTLIAAYKTLGGSFTGVLVVDPTHLGDLLRRTPMDPSGISLNSSSIDPLLESSDRSRRMRDAVESALSDILLLGTEEQVSLAAKAAGDLVAGRTIYTDELVVSLRNFIRQVLDLETIPSTLAIPKQGPTRPGAGPGGSGGGKGKGTETLDRDGAKPGGRGGEDGVAGGGFGMPIGGGLTLDPHHEDHR